MLEGYVVILPFRDITPDTQLIPLDNKNLICGCIALGALPVAAYTNGSKTQVTFIKSEAEPVIQQIQRFLSNIDVELPTDYGRVIRTEQMWQHLMSLQESHKNSSNGRRHIVRE